ncbi:MAG: TadE/TadG family type IV pilus assembly protein [Actinomycetota bacterium]
MPTASERGQSTVEFVLVLPLVLLLLLGLLQVGVMLRDQLLVVSAAREAAREAAVGADSARWLDAGRRAAPGLDLRFGVRGGRNRGDPIEVVVTAQPHQLPLVGSIVKSRLLRATATMRAESPSRG